MKKWIKYCEKNKKLYYYIIKNVCFNVVGLLWKCIYSKIFLILLFLGYFKHCNFQVLILRISVMLWKMLGFLSVPARASLGNHVVVFDWFEEQTMQLERVQAWTRRGVFTNVPHLTTSMFHAVNAHFLHCYGYSASAISQVQSAHAQCKL